MLSFHTGPLNLPAALRLRNRFMTVTLLSVGLGGTALAETLPETTRKKPSAPDMARLHTVSSSPVRPVTGPHAAPPAKQQAAAAQPKWYGVFGGANGAASGFGTVGPYGQARWAEDWSFLADGNTAAKRHDWFDRLKYIRLNDSGSIWLTLSGEERLRYIFETNPAMGHAGVTNASRVMIRNQYGADLHMGQHVRVYAELINAEAGGSNTYGYNTGLQRERLDLQQGFVEVKGHFLNATVGAMGGRQLFLDAPVVMQSARDIPNVQQTWDGFRGYAMWKRFRIDVFDFFQTNKAPVGIFSDGTNYSGRLYGAYTSTALPKFSFLGQPSQLYLDAFFMGYLYGGATASIATAKIGGLQAGSTRRDGIGGRLWGKLGPMTVSLDGIFQGGSFRPAHNGQARPVRAFAVNGSAVYTFAGVRGAPSIGVQADIFSGGNYDKTTGAVGTFGTPYFPLPYYNDVTLTLNSQNLVGVGPLISFSPAPKVAMRLHAPFFWRDSTQDAIYGIGRVYTPRSNIQGGYIGAEPQFQASWNFAPHWTWTSDVAGLATSHSAQNAGLKSSLMFMQTMSLVF